MKLAIIILLISLSFTCLSQKKIVKYESSTDVIINGKKKIKRNFDYTKYDRIGNKIEWGIYGQVQSSSSSYVGHLSHIDTWDYSQLFFVDYYEYDSLNRRISEKTHYFKDDLKNKLRYLTTYSYDSLNQLVSENCYDVNNFKTDAKHYFYDNENNVVKIIDSAYINSTQMTVYTKTKKYDSKKRIVYMQSVKNDELFHREKYIYNDNQNIVTTLKFHNFSDSSIYSLSKTAFDNSNPQKIIHKYWTTIDSKAENRLVYKYNRKGLLKYIYEYNGLELEKFTKYKYKYYK